MLPYQTVLDSEEPTHHWSSRNINDVLYPSFLALEVLDADMIRPVLFFAFAVSYASAANYLNSSWTSFIYIN